MRVSQRNSSGQRNLCLKFRWLVLLFGLFFLWESIACKKPEEKAEEAAASQPQGPVIKVGVNEFEGTVKVIQGKYLYMPSAQGFDVLIPGKLEGLDPNSLEGKEVKIKGEFSLAKPSILVAASIELKEREGLYKNIFTKTEEAVFDDYFDPKERETVASLKITSLAKSEEWEGKGKVKVFGKLEKTTSTEGGVTKDTYRIVVSDDKGKEIGKIIVDNFSDYALYYMKKLRLFDKFWFYINVKESVDRRVRPKTKELFHADVIFAGLY